MNRSCIKGAHGEIQGLLLYNRRTLDNFQFVVKIPNPEKNNWKNQKLQREQTMKIKELITEVEKLQIDPGFYCLSGKDAVRNTDYYGIARNKGKWEIYYCDWHCSDVRAVYDSEDAACEALYRILKDEEKNCEAEEDVPAASQRNS